MRFSKRKYPGLVDENWLTFDVPFANRYSSVKKCIEFLNSRSGFVASKAGKKVSYVSNKFFDEAIGQDKLYDCEYDQYVKEEPYILVNGGYVYFGIMGFFHFMARGNQLLAYVEDRRELGESTIAYMCEENENNTNDVVLGSVVGHPRAILLFKKFAEPKTKILPPKGKIKDIHCRYKSDLNVDIELLTANWYAQSLQGHPFIVRGHWRMQVCGQGRKNRKLKWIDPYMKDGYKKGAYMDETTADTE